MIDTDCVLCPVCGASQEAELPQYGRQEMNPSQYGGQGMNPPQYGGQGVNPPQYGGVPGLRAGLTPMTGPAQYYLSEQGKKRKEKKPKKAPDERLRRGLLTGLVAGAAVALLVSIYFLILIINRNSFLSGGDRLIEALPTYAYTINGGNPGEMKIESMQLLSREGVYSFVAAYEVTLSDDRMEHKLTLDIEGKNRFPFGWELTEVRWSERTQGKVTVKVDGISEITRSLVEQAVPTHKVQNFAIWVDQGKNDSFKGNCVISNTTGANYSIMGSYGYKGRIAPSVEFGRGTCDYALTIQRDTTETLEVSYGGKNELLEPVYVLKDESGEVRFQLKGISGKGISCEAYRVYSNGKSPAHGSETAPLVWNTERDPKTENPIASDRIGTAVYLFDEHMEIQVIIGVDSIEVICNGHPMEEHMDIPLKPGEWTGPAAPEPEGATVEG